MKCTEFATRVKNLQNIKGLHNSEVLIIHSEDLMAYINEMLTSYMLNKIQKDFNTAYAQMEKKKVCPAAVRIKQNFQKN